VIQHTPSRYKRGVLLPFLSSIDHNLFHPESIIIQKNTFITTIIIIILLLITNLHIPIDIIKMSSQLLATQKPDITAVTYHIPASNPENECPICQESDGAPFVAFYAYDHAFHKGCISVWAEDKAENITCPMCRAMIWERPNAAEQSMVDFWFTTPVAEQRAAQQYQEELAAIEASEQTDTEFEEEPATDNSEQSMVDFWYSNPIAEQFAENPGMAEAWYSKF
jgi:hypothetical protein